MSEINAHVLQSNVSATKISTHVTTSSSFENMSARYKNGIAKRTPAAQTRGSPREFICR